MGTNVGVGMSHHRNPRIAGREAAERALATAGINRPDFVFMFASVGYEQRALLDAVRAATAGAALAGGSGGGVIAGVEADESNFSVAVMTIRSDELKFKNTIAFGLKADSEAAGRTIAQNFACEVQPDTLGMIMLGDGLTLNFDRFAAGFKNELQLDRHLPLFGGTSADNMEFKQTYQYCDDQVTSDGVACVLLSGSARLAWSVNHGCLPIGGERKVTRCSGNVIYEIDGMPVLDVLKEYLVGDEIDNWSKAVLSLCMAFKAPEQIKGYDDYLIRFMPTKDDKAGSITIPTEVKEGTSIWMSRRDHKKISAGVERIGEEIKSTLGNNAPKLVFQFDCIGRGKAVFREQQKSQMLETLQQKIGPTVPWIGLYTYGEIGPIGGHDYFHNYTAVVLAVY